MDQRVPALFEKLVALEKLVNLLQRILPVPRECRKDAVGHLYRDRRPGSCKRRVESRVTSGWQLKATRVEADKRNLINDSLKKALLEGADLNQQELGKSFLLLLPRYINTGCLKIGTPNSASLDKPTCEGIVGDSWLRSEEAIYLPSKIPHRSRSGPDKIKDISNIFSGLPARAEEHCCRHS